MTCLLRVQAVQRLDLHGLAECAAKFTLSGNRGLNIKRYIQGRHFVTYVGRLLIAKVIFVYTWPQFINSSLSFLFKLKLKLEY